MEDSFYTDSGRGRGWYSDDSNTLHLLLLLHFIILSAAPPQVIRHEILKVGGPLIQMFLAS